MLTKYKQLLAIIVVYIHCHKYETDYIVKDCEKDCHLKKDTPMCDSFEIDCIEET